MNEIKLVQNDLQPDLQFTIYSDGEAVDLTGREVVFSMFDAETEVVKIDKQECVLVAPAEGTCRYVLQNGDTDTPGLFKGEVTVQDVGGGNAHTNFEQIDIIIRKEIS